MNRDATMAAAIAEYDHSFSYPHWTKNERAAARAAIRGLMVRLGRYDEFCFELGARGENVDAVS